MPDEDGGFDRADHEHYSSCEQGHHECDAPGAQAGRATMRRHGDPHTGPPDRADDQCADQIGEADHQTAQGQFHDGAARQFDANSVELSDRERDPDQDDAEYETALEHLALKEGPPGLSRRVSLMEGQSLKVWCEIVSAFTKQNGIRIGQQATRALKRHKKSCRLAS